MKPLRLLALGLSLLVLFTSALLLLNITAANPTGRRYSSEMPLIGSQFTIADVGEDAERILSKDLGLPNNNASGQRQCVCGSRYSASNPGPCLVCVAHSSQILNYRIPDFVGPGFFADSKNTYQLSLGQGRDFSQIKEIIAAAREAGYAFWIFTRVDTVVDPAYLSLFDGLQGGIVPYFAVAGFIDPLDQIAGIAFLFALILLVAASFLGRAKRSLPMKPPGDPPVRKSPADPLRKADEAGNFARRMKDRARQKIDGSTNGNH
jgi:hypothetical protein